MKINCYLVINSGGSVRVVKQTPSLNWNEISMKLQVSVPDKLFERPFLQAEIEIPESVVPNSPLNAEVVDNVQNAIREATNLEFNIKVVEEDERD